MDPSDKPRFVRKEIMIIADNQIGLIRDRFFGSGKRLIGFSSVIWESSRDGHIFNDGTPGNLLACFRIECDVIVSFKSINYW